MARLFDGVDDAISTPSIDLSAVATITVACWVWLDSIPASGDKIIFETSTNFNANNSIICYQNVNGIVYFYTSGTTGMYNGGHFDHPSVGAWHHYAFRIDKGLTSGEAMDVYVDGASAAITRTHDADTGAVLSNQPLYLMARAGTGIFAAGRMAEFAIYNALLTPDEIAVLAKGMPPSRVRSNSLAIYLPLWGPPADLSGNGNNGTLIGTSVVDHAPTAPYAPAPIEAPQVATAAPVDATVSPATIAITASVPATSVSTGATASPSVVPVATSLPAPTPSAGSTVSPSTISATVAIPATSTAFDPANVPGYFGHYQADTLTEADGAALATWPDATPAARNLTQATAANRPVVRANALNGKKVVEFTPQQFLDSATFTANAQPNTVFIVAKPDVLPSVLAKSLIAYDGTGASSSSRWAIYAEQATNEWRAYSGSVLDSNVVITAGQWYIIGVVFEGTTSDIRVNSTASASGNVGTHSPVDIRVGAHHDELLGWDGMIAEVLVYDQRVSSGNIASIEKYLRDKWGLGANATVTPGVIPAVASLPAAAPSAGSTIQPGVVATTAAVPGAGVSAGASPSAVPVVVTLPAVDLSAGATASPGAIAVVAALPQATVAAAGNATVEPGVITSVVALPAASLSTGASVSPEVITALTSLPAAAPSAGSTATPGVIPLVVALPGATVAAAGNITVSPNVVAAVSALPAASARAGSTVAPGVVSLVVALPAASVTAATNATASPATIAALASLPAAEVLRTATPTPATIAALLSIPRPGVNTGAGPGAVLASVTMPQVQARGDAVREPATVLVPVSMPAASLSTGSAVSPATIVLVVAFPAPTILTFVPPLQVVEYVYPRAIVRGRPLWKEPSP